MESVTIGSRGVSPLFIPEMIANIASGNVAILFHAEGPNLPVVTACATGTHSVGEAFRMIKEGRADAMITGGSEAAICEIAIGGFANSRALSLEGEETEITVSGRHDPCIVPRAVPVIEAAAALAALALKLSRRER